MNERTKHTFIVVILSSDGTDVEEGQIDNNVTVDDELNPAKSLYAVLLSNTCNQTMKQRKIM